MGGVSSFIGNTVGKVFGGITGTTQQAQAATQAAATQAASAQQGVDEQRRQFDKMVQLMSPYVSAGQIAMEQQGNLLGLGGATAQQQALSNLESSPQFAEMLRQGENAILQNASATGGLRGGNIQAALAQYRPQVLSDMINQQYTNLSGLTQMGQAAAAGQASAGMNTASNIGSLLGQQGAAIAGGQIAAGGAVRQNFKDLMSIGGAYAGAGGASGIAKLF